MKGMHTSMTAFITDSEGTALSREQVTERLLVDLLIRLYGNDWQFRWKGEDDGFSMTIEVEKTAKEQPCT